MDMTRQEIIEVTERIYNNVMDHYGESKHHSFFPHVSIEDTPFSDSDVPEDLYGEYCSMLNEITVYWKNIPSVEHLTRTLVHEYQHYLQSSSWMKRYYTMGYSYNDHPYEIAAFDEEKNWKLFI